MVSLRAVCGCIGVFGNISILNNFFGYRRNIISSLDTVPSSDSLLNQVKLLKNGAYIHLNIIQMGVNRYEASNFEIIERAIRRMRGIYAQVNIGIGKIEYYGYSTVEWVIVHDDCEAADITNSISIPNLGLDLFFVDFWEGDTIGRSATDGPCDKDNDVYDAVNAMTGSVVAIGDPFEFDTGVALVDAAGSISQVMAHEIGHYLGLQHYWDDDAMKDCTGFPFTPESSAEFKACLNFQPTAASARLMFPRSIGFGTNITMTSGEAKTMSEHCLAFTCSP